jgi:hypothetical protein
MPSSYRLRCALPTGCCLTLIVHLSRLAPGQSPFTPGVYNWAMSAWSLHLFINIAVTSLIAYRMYILRRLFQAAGLRGKSQSTGVLMTIIESGAVYSTTTVLLLGLGAAQSITCFAAIDASVQLSVGR